MMLIEKYTANPAATAFEHVHVVFAKSMRLTFVSAIADYNVTELQRVALLVYRDEINAWNVTNNQYLVYSFPWINQGWGASYALVHRSQPGEIINIILPAGTYTFAAYIVTDIANFKMVWALEEV